MSNYILGLLVILGGISFGEGQVLEFSRLGDCSSTYNGCQCKNLVEGCTNTYRSLYPWCEVDMDTCHPEFQPFIFNNQYFDFCAPDCQQKDPNQKQKKDTYFDKTCYSECENYGDILGDWCCTDEPLWGIWGIIQFISDLFDEDPCEPDYCLVRRDTYIPQPSPSDVQQVNVPPASNLDPSASYVVYDYPALVTVDTQDPSKSPAPSISTSFSKGSCKSIMQVLNETEDLSTMADIFKEVDVEKEINEQTAVTFFAPNNKAVDEFADDQNIDVVDFFLFKSNVAQLRKVVLLHLMSTTLSPDDLRESDNEVFPTLLNGQGITVNIDGQKVSIVPPFESSDIGNILNIDNPIEVCQGLLYKIDEVLIPNLQS